MAGAPVWRVLRGAGAVAPHGSAASGRSAIVGATGDACGTVIDSGDTGAVIDGGADDELIDIGGTGIAALRAFDMRGGLACGSICMP